MCLLQIRAHAQQWAASTIPVSLLTNANAVVRLDETQVEIRSLTRVNVHHHYVVTILNEAGDGYAEFEEMYDQFNHLGRIDGDLYNEEGKKIRSLRRNEIRDRPAYDGSFVNDARLKTFNFFHKQYPYTVEFQVEEEKEQTMFLPQWMPLQGRALAVASSSFEVETEQGYPLRFLASDFTPKPEITANGKTKQYKWTLSDFKAMPREYAAPAWTRITPYVMLAPGEFSIDDYKGNMSDWNQIGVFILQLNKNLDVLPEGVKRRVHELTAAAHTRMDTVEALYGFLQQSTRYVGVQLGIGGWRPFPATYVAQNGYGDCKALTNYMFALLKEAGIPSNYTLIRGGENQADVEPQFPNDRFNHVVLCVPNGTDSIWLECTSQSASAGYMGSFTGNRHALLVSPEGGTLVHTPVYGIAENKQDRVVTGELDEAGNLHLVSNTDYTGLEQDELHSLINDLSKDRVKEYLHDQLDFATFEVTSFNYSEHKQLLPWIHETLGIDVSAYATVTGKRLFINPDIMTRSHIKLPPDADRKFGIELGNGHMENDSVSIRLPKGYKIESIPKDLLYENPFFSYRVTIVLKNDVLDYSRSLLFKGGDHAAGRYADLLTAFEQVYKADRAKVVLVREEVPLKAF